MAALRLQKIKEMILKAYQAGHEGCLDLKGEYAEETITQLIEDIKLNKDSSEYKIFTPEQLRNKEAGTLFNHSRLGEGYIEGADNSKRMVFSSGEVYYFSALGEPWDEPMREIGKI